jgi:hypothetical protein
MGRKDFFANLWLGLIIFLIIAMWISSFFAESKLAAEPQRRQRRRLQLEIVVPEF